MRYTVQPRDGIFVKGYQFFLLLNIGMKFAKSISKNLSGKYSPGMLAMHQKSLDNAKQSVTEKSKTTSKRAIQKRAEATGDFIGNKTANKIKKI